MRAEFLSPGDNLFESNPPEASDAITDVRLCLCTHVCLCVRDAPRISLYFIPHEQHRQALSVLNAAYRTGNETKHGIATSIECTCACCSCDCEISVAD